MVGDRDYPAVVFHLYQYRVQRHGGRITLMRASTTIERVRARTRFRLIKLRTLPATWAGRQLRIPMNPPLPPFTAETAAQKARLAEDAWNTRDPARVALAYTSDSRWRDRVEFPQGRDAFEAFLTRKWQRELDYRLITEIWSFRENRIAVLPSLSVTRQWSVVPQLTGSSTSTA
jgi:hypothetical protein